MHLGKKTQSSRAVKRLHHQTIHILIVHYTSEYASFASFLFKTFQRRKVAKTCHDQLLVNNRKCLLLQVGGLWSYKKWQVGGLWRLIGFMTYIPKFCKSTDYGNISVTKKTKKHKTKKQKNLFCLNDDTINCTLWIPLKQTTETHAQSLQHKHPTSKYIFKKKNLRSLLKNNL